MFDCIWSNVCPCFTHAVIDAEAIYFWSSEHEQESCPATRQMCAEAEPCFQICGFCRIICLSISATPVSESSEIVVIYLFFSLWCFLNSEGVPLALSTAAAVLPLIFLASTQVSTAVTGQGCGISLVTHGHRAACAFTEDREDFCGISKVQPSQQEREFSKEIMLCVSASC